MRVVDLLTPDRIAVSLRVGSLGEAAAAVLERLSATAVLEGMAEADHLRIAIENGEGEGLDRRILPGGLLLVGARSGGVADVSVALGIAGAPFPDGAPGSESLQGLLVLLTPRDVSTLRAQAIPVLERFFADPERTARLLACRTTAEVRSFREFMDLELFERLRVEDALTPLTYRIYPDTPLTEVVDLMVRKNLQAVPVVGEEYEVLGIITAAEALRHSLPDRIVKEEKGEKGAKDEGDVVARDVMSRSVMCVSEDETLLAAANLMVNRDVAELPVVREGEIIGLLTRDKVLRTLFR